MNCAVTGQTLKEPQQVRKLIVSTSMTLDGVISSPAEWSGPYWDEQYHQYASALLFDADALLLGRETYEELAAVWPDLDGMEDDYAVRINSLPKHVASRTLTHTTWNATVIDGDVATEVAKLKRQPGQSILKFGTGQLDRTLMAHKLVDEYFLWVFPVIAGRGGRLLDGIDTFHLDLVGTTRFKSGVVLLIYAPK